jgi:hypothetical protein
VVFNSSEGSVGADAKVDFLVGVFADRRRYDVASAMSEPTPVCRIRFNAYCGE